MGISSLKKAVSAKCGAVRWGSGRIPLVISALLFALSSPASAAMSLAEPRPDVYLAIPWVIMLVVSVVLFVVGQLLAPEPEIEDAKPGSLDDFGFPTNLENRPIPLAFGSNKIRSPNTIWYGNLKVIPITMTQKVSLFKSKTSVIGHQYYVGFDLAVCLGPISGISLIKVGDEVLMKYGQAAKPDDYNTGGLSTIFGAFRGLFQRGPVGNGGFPHSETGNSGLSDGGSTTGRGYWVNRPDMWGGYKEGGGMVGNLTMYSGLTSVTPDSYISKAVNVDVPGYANLARVVWKGGMIGETTNIRKWDFVVHNYPQLPSGPDDTRDIIDDEVPGHRRGDANPVNVIYDVMTNPDYGAGIPPDRIDLPSFTLAADTVAAEVNGFSYMVMKAQQANIILVAALDQIKGTLYQDKDGKFVIHLNRDDYNPATLPSFDTSNITKVHKTSRQGWKQTFNSLHVDYVDREDEYKQTVAVAHDMGSINLLGQKVKKVKYPGIRTRTLAAIIAARDVHQYSSPNISIDFDTNRAGHDLFPGAVIKVTHPDYNLVDQEFRITMVRLGKHDKGGIRVTGVQDRYRTVAPNFVGGHTSSHVLLTADAVKADIETVQGIPAWFQRFFGTDRDSGEVLFGPADRAMHLVKAPNPVSTQYTSYIGSGGVYSEVTGQAVTTPAMTMVDPGTSVDIDGNFGPQGVSTPLVKESDIYLANGGTYNYPPGNPLFGENPITMPVLCFNYEDISTVPGSIYEQTEDMIKEYGFGLIQIGSEIMAFEETQWREGSPGEFTVITTGNSLPISQTIQGNSPVSPQNQFNPRGSGFSNVILSGLNKIHRGLFDTDIEDHAYGDTVFFLTLTDPVFDEYDARTGSSVSYFHRMATYANELDVNLSNTVNFADSGYDRPLRPLRPSDVTMQTLSGAAGHNVTTNRNDKVVGWTNQAIAPGSADDLIHLQDEATVGGVASLADIDVSYSLETAPGVYTALPTLSATTPANSFAGDSYTLTHAALETAAGWVYTRNSVSTCEVLGSALSDVVTSDTTGFTSGMVVTGHPNIQAGTTVDVITPSVGFTLSLPATGAVPASTLTFTGYPTPTVRNVRVSLTRNDGVLTALASPSRIFTVDGDA